MRQDVRLRQGGTADTASIEALLDQLDLPIAGVRDWATRFWIAEAGKRMVGVAGVELYEGSALLRSVAVDPDWRGGGLARRLVEQALDTARAAGAREVFLLTTTAEAYFPRLGFEVIPRTSVPSAVQTSIEFTSACPASAIAMRKSLA